MALATSPKAHREVSTKDIAQRLGVSPSTVSRALQGKLVSDDTIMRVRQVAEELGYHPNLGARMIARMMVSGKVGMYGLLVPTTSNPYFGNAVEIFQSCAFDCGHYINLGVYMEDVDDFRKYCELMVKERRVDGIIIYTMREPAILEILVSLSKEKIPIVLLAKTPISGIHWVDVDLESAGRNMGLHLLDLGHRRIGLIQGSYCIDHQRTMVSTFRDERISGFEHAMMERGVTWPADELLINAEISMQGGYEAARRLLACKPRPTAIFAINDLMASGALKAIHEQGLRVPEDISLAGFDNTYLAEFHRITSGNPHLDHMAQHSMDILQAATAKGFDRTVSLSRTVHTDIVVRESTGPVPKR